AAALLEAVRAVVVEHEEELGRMDAIAGDGDHGIGMRRGADAAADAAAAAAEASAGVDRLLIQAGEAWAEKAGGTSGALWGSGLIALAHSLGNRESYNADDALAAVTAFSQAITDLGKAVPGDKTMVDALLPYVAVFSEHNHTGAPLEQTLSAAADEAKSAAQATAELSPKKGRARPLAEKSIGHPDPGAVSFGLIAEGVARAYQEVLNGNGVKA
ncbi:dihydroxyacetone kinase subunit DhaL, partial [Arthrobacter sp. H14]|uniref:dihydroxyacetone kinase subunit DhaL n=1 Tax=Arthrobacter sp. H14 TaxID=1312959 RepID=UPI00047DBC04